MLPGGSAGIGKACAFAFSRNGCVLALAGRRLARLQAVVNELPSKAYAIAADLLVRADCERLVQEAVSPSIFAILEDRTIASCQGVVVVFLFV